MTFSQLHAIVVGRIEGERGFDPATAKVPTLKLKGGGQVPGSGPNKDTVPAMLAPGEFVMSRGAVQKYGSSTLASMNAAGGGTNLRRESEWYYLRCWWWNGKWI